ncbi:MAG: PKD domain-containing protein [Bacteroidia bacterium]|nr:PKD domain-containing protein [Bacteroidia bacterium]
MRRIRPYLIFIFLFGGVGALFAQAPPNDNCANATLIPIAGNGWHYGSFISDTVDITSATLQFGEFVHPAQVAQDKSVWYKFSIPTTRNVRIILKQTGPPYALAPTQAGWTLYRTQNCFPTIVDVVDPPILNIEGYTHECLKQGDYLIHVTSELFASGQIFMELQVSASTANETKYDYTSGPYNFGVVSGTQFVPASLNHFYDMGCQSVDSLEILCPDSGYTQSTWHVFTTDNFVDYIRFELTEDPFNTLIPGTRTWGYRLYEGNCILDPIPDDGPGLNTVDSCKVLSITTQNQYATTFYPCQLKPNTTYSIQLTGPTMYANQINVRMYEVGFQPTISPDPTSIPPVHQLGILPFNSTVSLTDYFACNAVLDSNLCGTVVPDTVIYNGQVYDMNYWGTFELTSDANVNFNLTEFSWQPDPLIRIFQGDVMTGGCNLLLYTTFSNYLYNNCLPAGKYSVQILGKLNPPQAHTIYSNLGKGVRLDIFVDQVAPMAFGLFTPQEIDSINGGLPLVSGNTYNSQNDYFDCRLTPLPAGDLCGAANDRVIYRLIQVNQDGILTVGGGNWTRFRYRLYRGDASSLPIVGNEIQGLVDQAGCQTTYWPFKVCVTPGYYTLATIGDLSDVKYGDKPWIRFESFPPTQFTTPATGELLDTLGFTNATVVATPTRFNCTDNPDTILGYLPCSNAPKTIYREFYLDSPQLVTFTSNYTAYGTYGSGVVHRIFNGRISQNTLTGLHRNCFSNFTECMQPGWYTVVTYGYGQTFNNPPYTTGVGASIGDLTGFTLTINPSLQKFGTFATAEQVNSGNTISWAPDYPGGHTPKIPKNYKTYTLGTEYWVCADNLPFEPGISPCLPSHNRVSYRVFTLGKASHVYITGLNPYPYTHQSRLYQGDITGLVPPFTVIQECISDQMRLCLQPGTYTLVTFAGDAHIGQTMTPSIYLDSLGVSKFDHALHAYDFDSIPNNSTEYRGKITDPPGPYGRVPSTDFFLCTTTAEITDPVNVCPIGQAPPGSALPNPTNPRQNLWYTFTVEGPGLVEVGVYNQTLGKPTRSPFAVYHSDDLNFPAITDSTLASGLSMVATSTTWYCGNYQKVSFYRDPCTAITKERYYVLVDRYSYGEPNTQIEVGVTFSPAPPAFVQYNHYSQANAINGNPTTQCNGPYPVDSLYAGTFTGCQGNLNCATKDPTDQNTCGTKTLWYTFVVEGTGKIRINYDRPGNITTFNDNDIQLYKQLVTGDSTSSGLVRVPLSALNYNNNPDFNPGTNYLWGEGCMSPGRYYIMFTGCNFPTETVVPRIWLLPQQGDLCSDPLVLNVDSSGTFSATAHVDCFTIGEAPGENGTNMGCLGGPVGYKSAWFKVNMNDTVKMDIDIQIEEFTNVTGGQIKYRIANGDCNYMTFDNCVSEGVFVILNLKCRPAGPLWVQVVMPDYTSDSIRLNVTATEVNDTSCIAIDPNAPRADFDVVAGCFDVPVQFLNSSTSGPGVTYYWDFGDGYSSTVANPIHQYAVPDTYLVWLAVDNGILQDTLYRNVIVYQRPYPNFTISPSPTYFVGNNLTFTDISTQVIPSGTYFWDFCAGPSPCGASIPSYAGPNPPPVSWSLAGPKKVCLTIVNGYCDSVTCFDIFVYDTTIFAGGSYDGHGVQYLTDSCLITEQNVFAGGPYDGHSSQYLTDGCTKFNVNIFAGGPYDGHSSQYLTDSCSKFNINVYAGGPYDGHNHASLNGGCPGSGINIFAGGPYDGDADQLLAAYCPNASPNVYAGGPYDGHGVIEIQGNCTSLEMNVFAGGSYDGFDFVEMYCDTIPVYPPDTNFCDSCFYAGGAYDGAAVAELWAGCPIPIANVFAGGPYDGHAYDFLTNACSSQPVNLFAGGPYDGHGSAYLTDSCSKFVINLFAGGPYDGHANQYLTDSCSKFVINLFAGGPYDGHSFQYLTDSCSKFLINLFAGGPYDGHSYGHIFPNAPQPFFAQSDTICVGYASTLTSSAPTNWFTWNGNYVWEAGVSSTYTTPVFYQAGTYNFWVDNPFICEKVLVQVTVLDTLAHPDFVFNPGCPGDSTFFTNQSIVPGPPQPSIGTSGFPIFQLGATGVPPGPASISFSSSQYLTYSKLTNGVNDQQNGWTANNSGPSTQWVQWQYLTPKSVSRFYYWPRNNCCANAGPTALRLYYDDGSGWVLVKTWAPNYPSNANFDTGTFFETANIYAQRWKLEVDVLVANAPSWGEFQVFASDPTVGGNAYWDFGDGFTSTTFDPIHLYGSAGTYNVNLVMDVPGMLCVNGISKPITIDDCGLLPLTQNLLSGHFDAEHELIPLKWEVEGNFSTAFLRKLADGGWVNLAEFEYKGSPAYLHDDLNPLFNSPNIYQVMAFDQNGHLTYSNTIEILAEKELQQEIILYPNPVEQATFVNLLMKFPKDAQVEIGVVNLLGQRVLDLPQLKYSKGTHRLKLNIAGLAQATYFVSVRVNGQMYFRKMVVIGD